jgi:hypothetical protein
MDYKSIPVVTGYSTGWPGAVGGIIATREEAIGRARADFDDDPEMMRQIITHIDRLQRGAHSISGEKLAFSRNREVYYMESTCRRAIFEYNATGMMTQFRLPSKPEMLALRYCSPLGEGSGPITAMIGELGCLHYGDARLPGGAMADRSTAATRRLEREADVLRERLQQFHERIEELNAWAESLRTKPHVPAQPHGKAATVGPEQEPHGAAASRREFR